MTRLTRHLRKRLALWRQHEGVITPEQRLRLAQWRRQEKRALLDAAIGSPPSPVWCLVANVVTERRAGHGGVEVRRGSKHFAPGAKVHCFPPLWDSYHKLKGLDKIKVVGRHRRTHRYVTMVTRTEWLTNWRVQLVYSPHVIREFACGRWHEDYLPQEYHPSWVAWDGSPASKERAEQLAAWMNS